MPKSATSVPIRNAATTRVINVEAVLKRESRSSAGMWSHGFFPRGWCQLLYLCSGTGNRIYLGKTWRFRVWSGVPTAGVSHSGMREGT